MEITDKTAIVTGGASGLGLATVENYIAAGANVAIFDMNEKVGKAAVERLGANASYFNVDVSCSESVQQAPSGRIVVTT
ncbi:SDR family NAD(P)-dependent oxidoreductase [Halioxenophilus aromaticivorans]|uniref:SDR family NAD(P)-dependent oxidoreductase n=1 Tax=Halioxenophilus aromaticivorans TaxID=1306992 RepID=A0AAV3TZX5_9ALTE